jgi:hypothetical protein
MPNTAERLDEASVIQEIARVERVGPELEVRAAGGLYRARRAVSCVVDPAEGDVVLAALTPTGGAWVLAILDRPIGTAPSKMSIEGDLEIAATGRLALTGGGELEIRAAREAHLVAPKLALTALDLTGAVERLVLSGGSAHVNLESVKTAVSYADQVFERLSTSAKRIYRYIEELDLTRARQIEMRAEATAHLRSKQTFMTSDDVVKVQADQIHLG